MNTLEIVAIGVLVCVALVIVGITIWAVTLLRGAQYKWGYEIGRNDGFKAGLKKGRALNGRNTWAEN
jgi:hypothetical protein